MLPCLTLLGFLGCPLPSEENARPNVPILQGQGKGQNANNTSGANNSNGAGNPGNPGNPGQGKPPTNVEQNQAAGGGQNAVPNVVRIEDGQGGGGQPGGVLLDMKQMSAQQKQEEITAKAHFTLAGEVKGECEGDLRVDVIGTENLGGPKEGGELKGPITTIGLTAPGLFTVKVPKGTSVNLTALCDGDRNQKITAEADQLSLGARLGEITEDVSGIVLKLEKIAPPTGKNAPK